MAQSQDVHVLHSSQKPIRKYIRGPIFHFEIIGVAELSIAEFEKMTVVVEVDIRLFNKFEGGTNTSKH